MYSPVFIVGANRSGTTLLRLILNTHSTLAIPEEVIYLDSYIAGAAIEEWQSPELSPAAYQAFVDRFIATRQEVWPELDPVLLREAILDGPHDLRQPYKIALEQWAAHYGKTQWGEKTPGNLFYVDILLEMFPDARFIHLVRDPRAGVASMQKVDFFPNDVVFNALNRHKHDIAGADFLRESVPATQRGTIRYEDLVSDTEATVRTVCEIAGLNFERAMLGFHEEADRYMKTEAAQSFNATATRPVSPKRLDKWRDQLNTREVAIVETVCAPVFKRYGYRPTNASLPLAARVEVLVKWLYWQWQSWRNRHVRHYTVKSAMFERSRKRLQRLLDGIT